MAVKKTAALSPLDASKVDVTETSHPRPVPSEGAQQIETATDHMVLVSWTAEKGWDMPKIVPYGPLSLSPASSVLNYGTGCYEGAKLYRGYDDRLRLLRPDYNCRRLLKSATRLALPIFDPQELLKLILKLCAMEGPKWLSKSRKGHSLYLRPLMMGVDDTLGIKVPSRVLLCIFLVYWPGPGESTKDIASNLPQGSRLLASSDAVARAFPKGTGAVKIGANYGPSLFEHARAQKEGYDQVLWLYGPERHITEAGGSNIFVIWTAPSGSLEIITPPLDEDQLILAGNTRWCVLELAREMFSCEAQSSAQKCEVLERKISMQQLQQAAAEGRIQGMFVTGTAWQIYPVSEVGFNGTDIHIPVGKVPHVTLLKEKMDRIVYGKEESAWAQVVEEEDH